MTSTRMISIYRSFATWSTRARAHGLHAHMHVNVWHMDIYRKLAYSYTFLLTTVERSHMQFGSSYPK